MFRGGGFLGVIIALAAAGSCAVAQEAETASPGAPVELRPAVARPAVKKPAPRIAAKAKPAQKPIAKSKTVQLAKTPAPQPVEHAPGLPTGSIKPPAASEKAPEKVASPEPPKAPPAEARPPFDEYVVTQFCTSLSSAASDGRLAWQAKRLEEMEARLRDRIAELDAKRAETADWLKRREEALKKADETVVAIYSKMKPDAAAAQFSAMDESGAAAILAKLNPRQAGIVLNEIDASRAARIAAEMAGVGVRREVARSVAP